MKQIFAGRNSRKFLPRKILFASIRKNKSSRKFRNWAICEIKSSGKKSQIFFFWKNLCYTVSLTYESNMLFQSRMKTFYAAEKWRNMPVKFWKNDLLLNVLNREIKSSRKMGHDQISEIKIYPNKVSVFQKKQYHKNYKVLKEQRNYLFQQSLPLKIFGIEKRILIG